MRKLVDRLAIELYREFGVQALDEALRRVGASIDAGDSAAVNRHVSVCFALERKREAHEFWEPVFSAAEPVEFYTP